MKKRESVAVRVIGLLFVGMVVYSLALFTVINVQLTNGFQDYLENTLTYQSEGVQNYIDDISAELKRSTNSLKEAFYDEYETRGFEARFVNDICHQITKYYDAEGAIIVDANGKKVTTTSLGSVDFTKYIKRAIAGEEVSSVFKDGKHLYAVVATPLVVKEKQVGAAITKQRITDDNFVSKIASLYDVQAEYYSDYTRVYSTYTLMTGSKIENTYIIDSVLAGEPVQAIINVSGEDYISYYFPIRDAEGNILTAFHIGKPKSAVLKIEKQIFIPLTIMASVITIILIFLIVLLIYESILKRLKFVGDSIKTLSSGDADLTQRVLVKGHNEFSELGKDVNSFIEILQSLVKRLNEASVSLEQIGNELGVNSQETASATTEIMANIASVRTQAEVQSSAVSETSNVLEQSGKSV